MEIEIFPPSPIECFLPPFPSPFCSHKMNMYLICFGSKTNLLTKRLYAIHNPILASSVQIVTSPCLDLSYLCSINYLMSLKPFLMIPYPPLIYSENSVHAPKASQIAIPSTEATALCLFNDKFNDEISISFSLFLKIFSTCFRSSSMGPTKLYLQ